MAHDDAEPDEEAQKIGERLRNMRMSHGLTIGQLAKLSNVPASTISKIENGHLRPSLVNAINLAQALGENLGFLIGRYRDPPQSQIIVRSFARETIHYDDMGLVLQDISGHFVPGVLEARIGILSKGAGSGGHDMSHIGEELCYVIAGKISYRIDGQDILLSAGQFIQFKSNTPHSWRCAASGEATVLWVFSDGLSF